VAGKAGWEFLLGRQVCGDGAGKGQGKQRKAHKKLLKLNAGGA
jgi:hypothetical protein